MSRACELRAREGAGVAHAMQTAQQVQRASGGESVCVQGVRGAHLSVWPREMGPVMPQTIAGPDHTGPLLLCPQGHEKCFSST